MYLPREAAKGILYVPRIMEYILRAILKMYVK